MNLCPLYSTRFENISVYLSKYALNMHYKEIVCVVVLDTVYETYHMAQ